MENKLALIIGVGPGLGLALSKKFFSEGLDVAMVARDKHKLETFAAKLKNGFGTVRSYSADVGDKESLESTIESIVASQGVPEVLIYNVSRLVQSPPLEVVYDTFIEDFKINVGGVLVAFQKIFPMMNEAGKGTILITGGGLSLNPYYEYASLGVGKAGLRNLSFSLAQEASQSDVGVYTVTINGVIAPDTKFDPENIAEKFYEIFKDGLGPREVEFMFG